MVINLRFEFTDEQLVDIAWYQEHHYGNQEWADSKAARGVKATRKQVQAFIATALEQHWLDLADEGRTY